MAKSTQVITDLKSAVTTAFTATQESRSSGPSDSAGNQLLAPQSLDGQVNLAYTKAQELLKILNELLLNADGSGAQDKALIRSGETNFTTLDSVRQVLV